MIRDWRGLVVSDLGDLRSEVLKQARVELRMNLSLLEMLRGNTSLEDLATLREEWVEPLQELIRQLQVESTVNQERPSVNRAGSASGEQGQIRAPLPR
jgi:hypothetical protein